MNCRKTRTFSAIPPSHAGSGKTRYRRINRDSADLPCFDVTKAIRIAAINKGCHTVAALKGNQKPEPLRRLHPAGDAGTERRTGETGY